MGANEKALIIPGLASPGPVYVLPSQFANAAKRSARCARQRIINAEHTNL